MVAQFSGEPRAQWIVTDEEERLMVLLEDFWFDDGDGKRWWAKKGEAIDGASIPRALWTLVGSPYTGQYRRASIVHDIACIGADVEERRAADRMFYEACRAGGCSIAQATMLYLGVRIGSTWATQESVAFAEEAGPRLRRSLSEKKIEADYQVATEFVLSLPESDDPFEIEARADAALAAVSPV